MKYILTILISALISLSVLSIQNATKSTEEDLGTIFRIERVPTGGTGVNSFSPNSLITSGPTATSSLMATTSNPLTVGGIRATSTATSTFAGGIQFSNNANICTSGGICLGASGSGSNWTDAGAYLTPLTLTDGLVISASSTFSTGNLNVTGGNFGIGTTTPGARLSVLGKSNATELLFNVASSSNFSVFSIDQNGTTSISFLQTGLLQFPVDGGVLTAFDLPVSGAAVNTVESYDFRIAASSTLSIWSQSLGSGLGIKNQRVGVATSTPFVEFSVAGTDNGTTTANIGASNFPGAIQLWSKNGTAVCVFADNNGTVNSYSGVCE